MLFINISKLWWRKFWSFRFYWNLWRDSDGKIDSDLPRPSINARDFESVVPRSGVSALVLGACAHAMTMSFTVLPSSAERATVLEVKSTATDLRSLLGTGLLRLRWQRVLHFICLFCFNILISISCCFVIDSLIYEIELKFITFFSSSVVRLGVLLCFYHSRSHHFVS